MVIELTHRLTLEPSGSYRVRVWVSEATGIDPKVFVMQLMPDTEGQALKRSRFSHVASCADLSNLPVAAPTDGTTLWRDSKIDMLVDGKADATDILDALEGEINFLIKGLQAI